MWVLHDLPVLFCFEWLLFSLPRNTFPQETDLQPAEISDSSWTGCLTVCYLRPSQLGACQEPRDTNFCQVGGREPMEAKESCLPHKPTARCDQGLGSEGSWDQAR